MLAPPPLLPRPDPGRRRLLRLYDRLHRRYGPQRWWPARSRFEVIVGSILTQNAAWRNAERAIDAAPRGRGPRPSRGACGLAPARLAELLRPSGTFRLKARRLRAFAQHVARRHGGHLGRLLALPLPALRAELRGDRRHRPRDGRRHRALCRGPADLRRGRLHATHPGAPSAGGARRGLRDRAGALAWGIFRTTPRSSTSSTRSWSGSPRSTAGRGRAARAVRCGSTSAAGRPGSRAPAAPLACARPG